MFARTNDWSSRIISKTHRPLSALINPHVSDEKTLVIDGKAFEHVRGVHKFFLPVPGTNLIVFVVDGANDSSVYHVFDMTTSQDVIVVDSGISIFGSAIGANVTQRVDSVENKGDGQLVLCTTFHNSGEVIKMCNYLDLNKKVVVKKTVLTYDASGKLVKEN